MRRSLDVVRLALGDRFRDVPAGMEKTMLGAKGLPLDELNRRGFVVTRPPGPKQMLNGFDYPTIFANLYLALDEAKYDDSRFIDFPDETIEVVRAGTVYNIFGADGGGAFLVRVADGTVHYAEIYTSTTHMRFANSDLRGFVRCRCFWQSLVWEERAFCLRGAPALEERTNEAMAERLRGFVARVDPAALESEQHYWQSIAFEHADMGIMLYPFLLYYMQRGRFTPP